MMIRVLDFRTEQSLFVTIPLRRTTLWCFFGSCVLLFKADSQSNYYEPVNNNKEDVPSWRGGLCPNEQLAVMKGDILWDLQQQGRPTARFFPPHSPECQIPQKCFQTEWWCWTKTHQNASGQGCTKLNSSSKRVELPHLCVVAVRSCKNTPWALQQVHTFSSSPNPSIVCPAVVIR